MTNRIGNVNLQGFSGNPELDAMRYAQQKGISLDEAKSELRSKFGDPQPPRIVPQAGYTAAGNIDFNYRPQVSGNNSQVPPEEMQLIQKGIPAEVIARGGEAIRKFAEENNISIPAKEKFSTNTNVSATAATTSSTYANSDLDYYNLMKGYEEVARNTNMSKDEKKNITRETKAHKIEISAWAKEYRTQKRVELKAELAKCSDKNKKKYLKHSYEKIINDPALIDEYIQTKFKEKYPNKDFNAVTYNIAEQQRSWFNKGPAGWSHHYVRTE